MQSTNQWKNVENFYANKKRNGMKEHLIRTNKGY